MREFKRVALEALLIAAVGTGIALIANAKNPEGLLLTKNYGGFKPPAPTQPSPLGSQPSRPTPMDEREQMKATIKGNGLTPIEGTEAVRWFNDPGYLQGMVLFVDARSDDHYVAGHVPGAYHLSASLTDQAQKQPMIDEILQAAGGAEKVVIYCNGGNCDDSLAVGVDLRDRMDPAKLLVDIDGFEAWEKAGLPIERGVRGSGDIVGGKK